MWGRIPHTHRSFRVRYNEVVTVRPQEKHEETLKVEIKKKQKEKTNSGWVKKNI